VLSKAFSDRSAMPGAIVFVSASIWGVLWIPLRGLEGAGLGPAAAVAAFNLPALAVAAAVFALRFGDSRGQLRTVALAGLLCGLAMAAYSLGLMLTTVIRATLLYYLTPVWGTLIGILWLGERPGPVRLLVLALGLAGLAALLGASPQEFTPRVGVGEALGLVSGFLWAIGAAITRKLSPLPASGLNFFMFLALVIFTAGCAPFLPASGGDGKEFAFGAGTAIYLAPSLLMLLSAYAILRSMAHLSPGRSGLLMMSEVIVAVFSAALLLPEELLSPAEWAGAAAIILAALIEIAAGEPERQAPAGARAGASAPVSETDQGQSSVRRP